MERARHISRISNLFKPSSHGFTTYDMTYVTSRNNDQKDFEREPIALKGSNQGFAS